MIERLILVWAHFSGDRLIPFFRVVEFRIDVKDDTAKGKQAMPHHLTNFEPRAKLAKRVITCQESAHKLSKLQRKNCAFAFGRLHLNISPMEHHDLLAEAQSN